ncbi:MAG: ABC transporter ATP-binding protein [Burkholderiaceae bacterium]
MLSLAKLSLKTQVDGQSVDVLRDITFSLERGKVLGLVGESGAGKSLIGRLIAGHTPPGFVVGGGSIAFDGMPLLQLGARERRALLGRRIGFIPQEPLTALNPVFTIGQTFDEHLMLLGVERSRRAGLMLEQMHAVHLTQAQEMLRRYPHELSGGQCQRVLIAMAFSAEPSLIIADEPTTALDVVSQSHVLALLAELQRRHGSAVLLITHDLRLAAHVCDDIVVLYAGEQVEYGPAVDVLKHPRHPYTRALQDATPDIHGPRRHLPAIEGQMPGVSALANLAGCRFAERCPTRNAACAATPQTLHESRPGHWVRCVSACEVGGAASVSVAPDTTRELVQGTGQEQEQGQAQTQTQTPTPTPGAQAPRGDAPASPPLVELQDVTLRYTARRGLWGQRKVHHLAVNEVSLQVRPGEFVGIVGESGSGKSSVARLIVGAEQATSGRILVEGRVRGKGDEGVVRLTREHVQMIFQDPHSALNPRRSVFRLLTQAYEVDSSSKAVKLPPRAERGVQLLRDVGLAEDCLMRFPSQLSGGQKQRVNIGRALCVMPRLVVADEIVSGLDVSVQAQILNLLLDLGRRHGVALLLISHDLSVVRYLCSRVLVMQAGCVVEQGSTDSVFANPQHAYTRLLLASVPPADPDIAWPVVVAAA